MFIREENNLIGVVDDTCIGYKKQELNNPIIRYASRGIVIKDDKIAIFNKVNKNEYKLPGGGIDKEDKDEYFAFEREVLEECGCYLTNVKKIGYIVEEKGQTNFRQLSYVFVGEVLEDTKKLHLTKKETEEGARLIWCTLDEAIKLVVNSRNNLCGSKYDNLYQSLFMVCRDEVILKYYRKNKDILEDISIKKK